MKKQRINSVQGICYYCLQKMVEFMEIQNTYLKQALIFCSYFF